MLIEIRLSHAEYKFKCLEKKPLMSLKKNSNFLEQNKLLSY